ncbi:MAG: NAD(P)/FAD-dependent oxidoreductase [Nevskiaceae bacterium]|nr:MAG: NAD(P)/FAD-dependent oxidoreductase [Nevskiaceae bacterium]TBR71969.1 MAG: NAD(P)/FAD-dependent oxidoreductase [Nevskiaceae bacterium]
MTQRIESDYLVTGAGGMGMAFVDEILTQTDATVTIVDRKHRPGGHWNDAYPHVRLHQPSACYGVNSTPLGKERVDEVGLNKGCYELASGSEVVAYFDTVMRDRFLPSGRVTFLPATDYKGDRRAVSRSCGTEYEFAVKKIVDATYLNVTVPSQRPPKFGVEGGAVAVPPNELPRALTPGQHFVIVGSGKTGIDACLFLLTMGVPVERITWIMPNDAWLFDRFTVNLGRKFTDICIATQIGVLNEALAATSVDDYFQRLLAAGHVMAFDPAVKPTRWRCATVTPMELEQIRKIKNVVRMGHVESVAPGVIRLEKGVHRVPESSVFIDCAADGLTKVPAKKVFDGTHITLQSVRMCQQVYSAGFIANVEINVPGEARKNELCRPVPHPYLARDYLRCAIQNSENMLTWLTEPAVVKWINESRIDLFSPYLYFDDPQCAAGIEAMCGLIKQAVPKLQQLLEDDELIAA